MTDRSNEPRHISDVLAELAETLPPDVRATLGQLPDDDPDDEDRGLPLGWEGVEVVE